jgi:uncharacterized protein YndB with AHSA1/START domain
MTENTTQFTEPQRRLGHRTIPAGEARSAIMTRRYDASIEDVWSACTDPERLARWFVPVAGDLRQGGSYNLEFGVFGEVLRCDPPRLLTLSWAYKDMPVDEVELRLAPDGNEATLVEVEHATVTTTVELDGRLVDAFGNMGSGWEPLLVALELFVDGRLPAGNTLMTFRERPEIVAVADRARTSWTALSEASR